MWWLAHRVENGYDAPREGVVRSVVVDSAGQEVARTETPFSLAAGQAVELEQRLRVATPRLWSLESPALYALHSVVAGRAPQRRPGRHDVRHPHHRLRQGSRVPAQRPPGEDAGREPASRRGRPRRGRAGVGLAPSARDAEGDGRQRRPHLAQPAGPGVPGSVRPAGLPRHGRGVRRMDHRQGARGLPPVLRRVVGARRGGLRPPRPEPSFGRALERGERDRGTEHPGWCGCAAPAGRHLSPRGPDPAGHHRQRPDRRRRPSRDPRVPERGRHRGLQLRGPLARAAGALRRAGPARAIPSGR